MDQLSKHIELDSAPVQTARRYPISSSVISGLAAGIDSFAILMAGALIYGGVLGVHTEVESIYVGSVCFVWISILLLYQLSGLYKLDAILHPISYIDKLAIAVLTSVLFFLAATFAFKISSSLPLVIVAVFGVGAFASTLVLRLGLSQAVLRLASERVFTRNVVVSGSERHVVRLLSRMHQLHPDFISVMGVFAHGCKRTELCGVPVLGTPDDLAAFVRQMRVDDVVLAVPWSAEERVLATIEGLRELPVNVYLASDLAGLALDFRDPPDHFGNLPVFGVIGHPLSGWGVAIKAAEDYILASFFIVLALPLMGLIALAIRFDSPGPVLFRQKRLGFNNQEFDIYKFRTMRHVTGSATRTIQATPNDPRVTSVGHFLRRSSLDELPQLFNVLNGTMSLVGPRPHAIDHNKEYSRTIRGYFARHRVKPGITGWAQVKGLRGQTDTPAKMTARVTHDVYYTENWSLFFDLQILARTILALITARNAH